VKRAIFGSMMLSVALATSGLCEGEATTFSAPRDKVFSLALEVIGTEWRVEQANKETGLIAFRSGMSMKSWKGQDLSLLIIDNEGGTKVLINAEKRGAQLGAWGEGGKLAKKALNLIGKRLFKEGLIPEAEIPKK
jgi:hypothetical protein